MRHIIDFSGVISKIHFQQAESTLDYEDPFNKSYSEAKRDVREVYRAIFCLKGRELVSAALSALFQRYMGQIYCVGFCLMLLMIVFHFFCGSLVGIAENQGVVTEREFINVMVLGVFSIGLFFGALFGCAMLTGLFYWALWCTVCELKLDMDQFNALKQTAQVKLCDLASMILTDRIGRDGSVRFSTFCFSACFAPYPGRERASDLLAVH